MSGAGLGGSGGGAHRLGRVLASARDGASRALATLGALALPQRCPECGAPAPAERVLCAACWTAIPRAGITLCARCLAAGGDPSSCRGHRAFRAGAAWLYDERAAAVVAALKYQGRPGLARALAIEVARAEVLARADFVTETPLHPARRRERGYNQAERLAAAVAAVAGVPHLTGVLARPRPASPQARRGPRARREQAHGAFTVAQPAAVRGRRIVVVDDVMTTGATIEACLAALAAAGARPAGLVLAWAQ